VNALRDRQTALVDLYKALGGGWSPDVFAQTSVPPAR
jgi:outer membrane protein TolC